MTDRNKHPAPFRDNLGNAILQMAQDGLVIIDGDKVTITEKGRLALSEKETK